MREPAPTDPVGRTGPGGMVKVRSYLPLRFLAERIEVTEGAHPASQLRGVDIEFEPDAWVPSQGWHRVGPDDLEALTEHAGEAPYWACVDLVQVPSWLIDDLMALNSVVISSPGYNPGRALDDSLQRGAIKELLGRWSELVCFGPVLGMGITTQPGGCYAATLSDDRSRKVGLHIDAWDGKHWDSRRGCTNRISINIGRWPRSLVFASEPVTDLYQLYKASIGRDATGLDLIRFLQATRPHVRYVRLQVNPGEAYIAPTENVIHDGCSELVKGDDKQIVLRGFFGIEGR